MDIPAPQSEHLVVSKPVHITYISHFLRTAASLEEITVNLHKEPTGSAAQLITLARLASPKLHTLTLSAALPALLSSVCHLSRLQSLTLRRWEMPGDLEASHVLQLSNLRKLETLILIDTTVTSDGHAAALADSLESLPRLTMLIFQSITLYRNSDPVPGVVTRLTQLRCLGWSSEPPIHANISHMLHLTTFKMASRLGCSSLWDSRQLTQLQTLYLKFAMNATPRAPLITSSQRLTQIELYGDIHGHSPPRDILSTYLPEAALIQMTGLQELVLHNINLNHTHLDNAWMTSMPHLTMLDLSHNNIGVIPHTLLAFSRLQALKLQDNTLLQITPKGIDALSKFSHLTLLSLAKNPLPSRSNSTGVGWSDRSMHCVVRLKCRVPDMEIVLE